MEGDFALFSASISHVGTRMKSYPRSFDSLCVAPVAQDDSLWVRIVLFGEG